MLLLGNFQVFSVVVYLAFVPNTLCEGAETTLRPEETTSSVRRPKPKSNRDKLTVRLCRRCRGKPCEVNFSAGPLATVICMCKPSCLNEAKCDTTGKCQCPPGFSGEDCGIPDSNVTCSSLSCQNGGSCLNYGTEGHHCSCPVPFSGRTCHMPYENSSHWCNEECGKRNRVCKPHLHDDQLISFECLEESEPCRIGPNCQNGYCEKNSTNDCICKECWHGEFCDFYCCKKCLNGGRCVNVNGDEACECPVAPTFYTGELCEYKKPAVTTIKPPRLPPTYKYILVASGGILLLLIVALVAIPYILWKKRVLWIMKIVYKFQTPVEVGLKEYHAFVSYCGSKTDGRSPDEQFVLEKLQKKLEGEYSFRLCLHYRDFLPGVAIAENIIYGVEKSHRTILVLSKRFVESEWCQLEYQKAQHEMLMRRHKIIPVIFEHIDQCDIKDKNLLDILKAVTYIVWPGDDADPKKLEHFWKKLVYSMPKKGGKSLESYPSTSSGDTEMSDLGFPPENVENEAGYEAVAW